MGCGESESERSKYIHTFCFLNAGAKGLSQVPTASAPAKLTGITSHQDGLQKGKINPSLLKCFSRALLFFNNEESQPARRLVAPGALSL